ncbi:MAG: hypothetical protein H0X72_14275 [Acidobacteria bacterium]|jgi:hypothetical protein|nr:hypothetical protein [Acidobacteriota bacterium]
MVIILSRCVLREENRSKDDGDSQQIIGREGETATLLSKLSVKSKVVAGGFAPRQLNRSMLRG